MKTALMNSALALTAAAGLAMPASAVIIAGDSYNDYPGGAMAGQTGSNTVGFDGNGWIQGSANIQTETGGILDGSATSGQIRYIPSGSSAFRRNQHLLDPIVAPLTDNTVYTSQLLFSGGNNGTADQTGEYMFTGFGSFVAQDTIEGTANFLLGAFTGFVVDDEGNADLVIRSRTGAAAGSVSDTLLVDDATNTTFNVVMALEFNNPGDEIRYWVNPTNFFDEDTLTATAAVSGSISGFQLGALTDLNRLTVLSTYANRSYFVDETYLATSTQDLGPVIPEPASLALLGLGGLAALGRRRKA